jgi:hypothetical protein
MTLIHQRSFVIAVTTSSTPRYGQGLLSGEQSEMSSGGNGSGATGRTKGQRTFDLSRRRSAQGALA